MQLLGSLQSVMKPVGVVWWCSEICGWVVDGTVGRGWNVVLSGDLIVARYDLLSKVLLSVVVDEIFVVLSGGDLIIEGNDL